jgi:glycosidase
MAKTFFEFHVKRDARIKFNIEETLFAFNGDLIIANFKQARLLAQKINEHREPDRFVTAGNINALGLLHEIFHYAIRHYEENENPGVFERGIKFLKEKFGNGDLDKTLIKFIEKFPPLPVFRKTISPEDYLIGATLDKSNKEIILEELILLHLENLNPAFVKLSDLFDDTELAEGTNYKSILEETDRFFSSEKPFGPENLPLIQSLKKPIFENPDDALKQLDYIKIKWRRILNESILSKIIGSADLFSEEARFFEKHEGFGGGKPTPPVPIYRHTADDKNLAEELRLKAERKIPESTSVTYYEEPERFTEDSDWMPNVVMMAKNTYVWLDQLSKKYGRSISKLNEIPDEELNKLADWNITALWLIGIWERSRASQKIKQYMGNIEAAPSAYSLFDYEIAYDLGGEEAFQQLKARAWSRGIRIASDMVPNHTGIFSKWIIEHPEYFIQSEYPPFPNYSFTGIDLSDNPGIQLRIEDRYYNKTDAAVVFQRIDNSTGKAIYIYHGNDGTNMPWNDTAQLNLLKPEVREALIQTIMKVARKSPIIRFDAAMTLAKKHYQRLWFPLPGTAGAIPSRADYSMSRDTFDSFMPVEFWREVVDRMNSEMPNTLLLAEAFWLMEGYFVRTLGMHRVYNSAFMHMFMKEENDKFRTLIKNTLEYNPEILKRYVNFMSNPDEETAINQFGKGDKYFGVAVMMVTIPGLPMFGHGQVEGLTEKYGMEYRKAYYNEFTDENLVNRHCEEIFPLMKKRDLFSQVEEFELFDFIDDNGNLNENVICFSNMTNREKCLVFYNNSYSTLSGSVNYSNNKIIDTNSEIPVFSNRKLADALHLNSKEGYYYTFRDHKSKMEYLVSGKQIAESGFYLKLWGYQYFVFLNFTEVFDTNGDLKRLDEHLNGCGVPSINRILQELKLANLHHALKELLNYNSLAEYEKSFETYSSESASILSEYLKSKIHNVLSELKTLNDITFDDNELVTKIEKSLLITYNIIKTEYEPGYPETIAFDYIKNYFFPDNENHNRKFLFSYLLMQSACELFNIDDKYEKENMFGRLLLDGPVIHAFDSFNHSYMNSKQELDLLKILLCMDNIFEFELRKTPAELPLYRSIIEESEVIILKLIELLNDELVKSYIGVNTYEGIEYYGKENFEKLLDWLFVAAVIRGFIKAEYQESQYYSDELVSRVTEMLDILHALKEKSDSAEYKIGAFIALLS